MIKIGLSREGVIFSGVYIIYFTGAVSAVKPQRSYDYITKNSL